MKKAVFLKNKKNKKNIQIVNNHQHNLRQMETLLFQLLLFKKSIQHLKKTNEI